MDIHKTSFYAFPSVYLHLILLFLLNLLQPNKFAANALGNETDRFALLKFKESISKDPHGFLSSWNDSVPFCNWHGITCSKRHPRITALELQGSDLRGSISPFIGNLSFLRFINLGNNSFSGEIPQQVGYLFRLRYLSLSDNMLEGKIPSNLSYCSELRLISFRTNRLSGRIPWEVGTLVKLLTLNLGTNNLTGGIPASLGNLSSIRQLSLAYNNLEGTVPDEIGELKSLTYFAIGPNNLSGMIPASLYNVCSINTISLTDNQFHGTLPPTIGLRLPNLHHLGIGGNEFSGKIPETLSNASKLQILDITENNFVGQVPAILANLQYLRWLGLSTNSLGSYSPKDLDFLTYLTNCSKLEILDLSLNNFGGVLPTSIANLSTQLNKLYLGVNQISGNIPASLVNLVNLIVLGMTGNLLTGVIPTSFGKFQKIQILALDGNILSGEIPSSIGNLSQLFQLYLSYNKLEGRIPQSIGSCQNLQLVDFSKNGLTGSIPREVISLSSLSVLLNLSHNSLTGNLPVEVGKLKSITTLDISDNNLSGEIPDTIGGCQSLEFLFLQENSFVGILPSSLVSLHGLQCLDLSQNNLSGQIPKGLHKVTFLTYLNLSFNNFEGEVPKEGVFHNASLISVVGNPKLCGGVPELNLPACSIKVSKQGKSHEFKLPIILICVAAAFFLLFSSILVLYWRRKSREKLSSAPTSLNFLSKVSYKRLYQATSGFSPNNLIGTGGFGSVYKGILDEQENAVAIKVLNLHQKGASKSFIAECNALRSIRHRNLVKILTCCSSMDYSGNEFKALVFEYMSNGSLEKWLHPIIDNENGSESLNLLQRLNIAMDVASALYYLHHHCEQPIIHCDLKPSNILMDNDMVAHVCDFGLARVLSNTTNDLSQNQTTTNSIRGTIGYAAPEYAMGGQPSRQGDVYSYGILLLEIFTGRKPTNEMFKDSFNLHNFVKMAIPERLVEVADSGLKQREEAETSVAVEDRTNYCNKDGDANEIEIEEPNKSSYGNENQWQMSNIMRKCLISVFKIGLACSEESPKERMEMQDVIRELQHTRSGFMDAGIHRDRRRRS